MATCCIATCSRSVYGHGWCRMHYARWRRHGDPERPPFAERFCSVDGCGRRHRGLGYCHKHLAQFHKAGSPTGHKPRKPATGHFDADGYRAYTSSKGGARKTVREHRIVWETHNGPIPAGYVVHHINGDKADNRLENLQLMTRSEHAKHHQCTPANDTRLLSLN